MYGTGTGNLTVFTRTLTSANTTLTAITGNQKQNVWMKASVSLVFKLKIKMYKLYFLILNRKFHE